MRYQEAVAWTRGEEAYREFARRHVEDIVELARTLDFDLLRAPSLFGQAPTAQLDEWNFLFGDPDGDHVIRRFDPDAKTFAVAQRGFATPPPQEPDELEPLVEQLEAQAAEAPGPDAGQGFAAQVETLRGLCGDEFEIPGAGGLSIPLDPVWLMACIERPDLVGRRLDASVALACREMERAAALGLRVIWAGGDLAGKGGPFYGPGVFRRLVLPRVKRLVERCHQLGLVYLFRTDGDLWSIEQEFFVESGIDGYGEIDYEAGMDLDRLKARHGDRITFWGNVPCGTILHHGTTREVVDFTKHIIDVAAPGGGFMLGSSNCVMPGTPARNVMAMVETARTYGRY